MFQFSDRNALQLSQLLVKYFADCFAEDPGHTPASELTVLMLVEDLASSTSGPEQRAIEECIDAITGLQD